MGFSLNPISDVASLGNTIGNVFEPVAGALAGSGGNTQIVPGQGNAAALGGTAPGMGAGMTAGQPTKAISSTPAGAAGYTVGVNDPSTLAGYDQAMGNINTAIGQLAPAQTVFDNNLQGGYTSALNGINQQQAADNATYTGDKTQTGQNFVQAKDQIGDNASSSLNSLLRLLGSRGAGGSSDYQFAAPQAVATQAAQQRSGAGQTFAQNDASLDTNWNNYLTGVNKSKGDLQTQLTNQQNAEAANVANNKASLLQQLASLSAQKAAATGGNATGAAQPFLDQANNLVSQATQLGQQAPVFNVAPQTYSAPSLSSYEVNPFAPAQTQNPTAATDLASPYLSLLLGNQKDKTATNLGA